MKLLKQLSVEKLEPDQEHVIAKTKNIALVVTEEVTAQEKESFIPSAQSRVSVLIPLLGQS